MGLVVGSLKGSHLAGVLFLRQQHFLALFRFLQQLIHFRLRQIGSANLCPLLLDFLFQGLKLWFAPGRWKRRSRLYQVFPFQILGIEQRGHIRLPRLSTLACGEIGDLRRVVFIGQSREMMPELVDPDVKRPDIIDRDYAVKIENPSAAIRVPIHQNLHELVGSVGSNISQSAIFEGQDIAFRVESVIRRAQGIAAMNPARGTRDA